MYRVALLAVLVAGVSCRCMDHQEDSQPPVGNWTNANEFIDSMLKTVNSKLPARMNITLNETMVTKLLHIHDCFIYGLDKGIHRVGNATKMMADGGFTVNSGFGMTLVGGQCDWMFLLQEGTVGGDTADVEIHMQLDVPLSFSKHPTLLEFHMLRLGDLNLKLTGWGVLDKPTEKLFSDVVNGLLHPMIITVLNKFLPMEIQNVLNNMHV